MTTNYVVNGCPGFEGRKGKNNGHPAAVHPRFAGVNTCRLALTLAGLIAVGLILGVGCRAARAIRPMVIKHNDAIAAQIAD